VSPGTVSGWVSQSTLAVNHSAAQRHATTAQHSTTPRTHLVLPSMHVASHKIIQLAAKTLHGAGYQASKPGIVPRCCPGPCCLQDTAATVPLGLHSMHSSCADTRQLEHADVAQAAAATLPLGWHRGKAWNIPNCFALCYKGHLCKNTYGLC
jgi:hypothetical protein